MAWKDLKRFCEKYELNIETTRKKLKAGTFKGFKYEQFGRLWRIQDKE